MNTWLSKGTSMRTRDYCLLAQLSHPGHDDALHDAVMPGLAMPGLNNHDVFSAV
jgi:hypothetical protein